MVLSCHLPKGPERTVVRIDGGTAVISPSIAPLGVELHVGPLPWGDLQRRLQLVARIVAQLTGRGQPHEAVDARLVVGHDEVVRRIHGKTGIECVQAIAAVPEILQDAGCGKRARVDLPEARRGYEPAAPIEAGGGGEPEKAVSPGGRVEAGPARLDAHPGTRLRSVRRRRARRTDRDNAKRQERISRAFGCDHPPERKLTGIREARLCDIARGCRRQGLGRDKVEGEAAASRQTRELEKGSRAAFP